MNDFSKLKTRKPKSRLGPPPQAEAIPNNLQEPESAPSPSVQVDGRAAKATGRTEQFATRITKDLKKWLKIEAAEKEISQAELLERMKEAYIKKIAAS